MAEIKLVQLEPEKLKMEILNGIQNLFDDIKNHLEPKSPTEYLTRNDVSQMLSVDLSTVHNYTKRGLLQPYSIGSRVYYKRSEIEQAFIKIKS